ncbi:NAD(P)/FAD-dependent oxidoreductase [Streptomyces cavernae]|uniref:NAD(P)/FAD-dependent oxidoreductase n=1 Tax=Streptomyces cavernae TaxID=2259034 RepID=UPI000FEC12FF|nr:NAD(P)/FAD-dependent oxidoreductase [Streptomyces cavernae]
MTQQYEVVVVGGGAAGLAAALVLGRSRRRVLVVDAGEPRNAPAAHMHGYLSRDGMPPADFLAEGRREIQGYGVELVRERVLDAARDGADGFTVTLSGGRSVGARRLVIATGLVDELPDVPGIAERWGGPDVVHCPYCHGWEVRDRAFGVLATGPMSVHQALLVSQWSKDVVFFRHTLEAEDELGRLAAAGIEVVDGEVGGLVVEEDRLTGVRLADGRVHPREVLFVGPGIRPRTELLGRLGAELRETPFGKFPVVDETGRTTVPGVWAAGNAATMQAQVINAASAGHLAGIAINTELVFGDLESPARKP